jgi:hypothetical protein
MLVKFCVKTIIAQMGKMTRLVADKKVVALRMLVLMDTS